ncbi:MAG TPA: glycosyltransferase N-terminal domain-containing protein [Chthoniobacterales bacterium]|nr:glycosyltransferase N-terminal domain-containing protein [Chthoniobacterales bacterium]
MIRFFYNLLFPLALLFFLPGYAVKMLRRGNYRNKFGQRLGFYDRATRAALAAGPQTWLHAVSVGEVMIALKLASKMKEHEPALRIALTTTTTTGFALANKQAPGWIEVLYTPLDFWPIMSRAFEIIRPTRVLLVEAEVWPNLTAIAHWQKIPLALVNARLSPRSEQRFRKFNYFVRPYFQKLDLICVSEPDDVARWVSLGVDSVRIHPVGSIKFDPENDTPRPGTPRAVLDNFGIDPTRPILLAGSTHPGEEEIFARIFLALRREFPDLFLVIAPRHVERTRAIAAQLKVFGLTTVRRTEPDPATASDCLLLDTTGELRDWFAVATIVFIGKSLTARGGQNPVEAIVADRPVVFGPHMENFASLARALVAAGGALQSDDEVALTKILGNLLRDAPARERLVRLAREVLDIHRGATERTAQLLENLAARAV